MWYYLMGNQQVGPVDDNTISALIQSGTIIRQTLVWKEGLSDWTQAAQTELASRFTNVYPPTSPSYGMVTYPSPAITFQPKSLRTLWLWFAWLIGAGLPLSILCIGIPAAIAGVIVGYVLLYRYWLLIQDGTARTTPGKAVGFCFIPFYNFYWFYVAYVGLSKDMNVYCDERSIEGPRVTEGLALAWFILNLASIIPYTGLVTAIASVVILIILMKQLTDVSIRILEYKMK